MRKKVMAALAAAAVLFLVMPRATAASDEVATTEDNPEGCAVADYGNPDQCGAQGRNNLYTAGHPAPIDLCKTKTAASGSTITRIIPDGPRHPDHSLAFISGACVYLPPGYATSGLSYPVLYLLHGGGGDEGAWVWQGGIQQMLDDFYAKDASRAVIAIMPDGHDGNWHDDADGTFQIEQYVLRSLVPYVDRHFRTITDRRGRAIAGLSNGGYGALHFAAKAPDLFVAAGAMSSNVGARSMSGLGTHWLAGNENVQNQEFGAFYYGNTPTPLAANLDNVDVIMDLGTSCANEEDLSNNLCLLVAVDTGFRYDNEAFRDAMQNVKHVGAFDYRETEGTHTWRWWTTWLRERQLPFIYARLAKPTKHPESSPLPASFRYRSIASEFTIYGYRVRVDRPHPEFLDLADVTANSLTVTGTGIAEIYTPPRYLPGATYNVVGAGADGPRDADNFGRLLIGVDLGPGHADEQYSPAARAKEAVGQYTFVTRHITITRVLGKSQDAPRSAVLPRTGGSAEPLSLAAAFVGLALAVRGMNRFRTAE
jgi:S-formylglutathione hydrolase FrmB